MLMWRNGRRARFRSLWEQSHAGSNPVISTKFDWNKFQSHHTGEEINRNMWRSLHGSALTCKYAHYSVTNGVCSLQIPSPAPKNASCEFSAACFFCVWKLNTVFRQNKKVNYNSLLLSYFIQMLLGFRLFCHHTFDQRPI